MMEGTDAMLKDALAAAATAVRAELIRLDYVEGSDQPDDEDRAIAAAAIKAWMDSLTRASIAASS